MWAAAEAKACLPSLACQSAKPFDRSSWAAKDRTPRARSEVSGAPETSSDRAVGAEATAALSPGHGSGLGASHDSADMRVGGTGQGRADARAVTPGDSAETSPGQTGRICCQTGKQGGSAGLSQPHGDATFELTGTCLGHPEHV
jgi:hypothetical protein